MSKFNTGMMLYAATFLTGVGLLIANFAAHIFDGIPNGFRIAVVIYALTWFGIRIWLGRKGYFVARSNKPNDDV
jgi:hypothetical protein